MTLAVPLKSILNGRLLASLWRDAKAHLSQLSRAISRYPCSKCDYTKALRHGLTRLLACVMAQPLDPVLWNPTLCFSLLLDSSRCDCSFLWYNDISIFNSLLAVGAFVKWDPDEKKFSLVSYWVSFLEIRIDVARETNSSVICSLKLSPPKTRPDTRHKMRLVCVLFTFENNTGHTDGRTDGHNLI